MGHGARSMRTLLQTKPIETCLAEAEGNLGFKRLLDTWDLTLLGIGAVMGTGIFVLTGRAAAANAGPAVVLSLVVAAVAASLGALCYAEMASILPISGSVYTYAYATLGEVVAFLIGWDLILEYMVGAATVGVGWSAYSAALIEQVTGWRIPWEFCNAALRWDNHSMRLVQTGAVLNVPAVLIILSITTLLIRGVHGSKRFNSRVVVGKVAIVLLFVACCMAFIKPQHWRPFMPPNTGTFGEFGVSGMLQGASLLFFAYLGVDNLSTAALETKNPQRTLPRAMLFTMGVCLVLYIGVALALTGVLPHTELGVAHPLALAAHTMGLPWLEVTVALCAVLGLTSVLLVQLFGQPRIFFAMAHDGLLPSVWAKVHRTYGTPHVATWSTGVVCAAMSGLFPIETLGEMCSVGTLFAFILVSLGVLVLRLRQPDLPRVFKVPGGAWTVPLLSMTICVGLMTVSKRTTLVAVGCWLLLGLAVYLGYGVRHARLRRT